MIQDNKGLVQRLLFLMLLKHLEEMISFVMSVRPSVRMQQLGPTVRIFMKFNILGFFENVLRKFEFH